MMTTTPYHIALNGTYVPCNANIRGCPRGGHATFTPEQVEAAVAEGDARFIAPPKVTLAFAKEAENGMEAAQQDYADAVKVDTLLQAKMDEWKKENAFDWGGRPFGEEAVKRVHHKALTRLHKHLIDAGVSQPKAGFIIQDVKKEGADAFQIPVKKRDKFDPDIEAKTTAARAAAEADREVALAREVNQVWAARKAWGQKHAAAYLAAKNEAVAEVGGVGLSLGAATGQLQASQQELANRREWYFSGVHEKAEPVKNLSDITPDKVAVNDKGEITNVWLAPTTGGPAERVARYVQPTKLEGFNHGYFETESGKRVAHVVRYANYRRTETNPTTGDTRVLLGPVEDADKYPTDGLVKNRDGKPYFHVTGEVDSGG